MATSSDTRPRLSESLSCSIAGLTPSKRRAWVNRGVLPKWDAKAGFSELQVIHLSVVRILQDVLGPHDGKVAWNKIGDEVLENVLQPRLDLVVVTDRPRCALARDDRELSDAVRCSRSLWVIPLADEIAEVRSSVNDHWQAFQRNERASGRLGSAASESA